jgi:hypothetical protein
MADSADSSNYFLALDVDPDEPYDEPTMAHALARARNRWSTNRNAASLKRKAEANRYLALLDDMSRVMLGTTPEAVAERLRHAARARDAAAKEKTARRQAFSRRLSLILEKGFLYDVEIAALTTDFPTLVAEADTAARIAAVEVRRHGTPSRQLPEGLDQTVAAEIESLLASLGEESLYTLLAKVDPAVSEHSGSLEQLRLAAEKLYRDISNQADKQKAGVTATTTVSGHAKRIFSSQANRDQYDTTRRLAPVTRLIELYRQDLGQAKEVSSSQFDRFLREVRAVGFEDLELAQAMFEDYFGQRNWRVHPPTPHGVHAAVRLVECWSCQFPLAFDALFCRVCGAGQQSHCPRCATVGKPVGHCVTCGFPVGESAFVEYRTTEAERLLDTGDLDAARTALDSVQALWPLPPTSTDALASRMRAVYARIAALTEAHREMLDELAMLRAARKMRLAAALLAASPASLPGRAALIAATGREIAAADALYAQAMRPGTTRERRAACLAEAHTRCADHAGVLAELRRTPPEPPSALTAHVRGDGAVELRWRASPADGARYVVMRGTGTRPPGSLLDGIRLAAVTGTYYTDPAPERGVPLRYAIYADREGIPSATAATSLAAVFLTADVQVRDKDVSEGEVTMSWQLPRHATGASVRRRQDTGAETVLALTSPTSLHDRGLTNGVLYTYVIRALFRDDQGREQPSPGVTVRLTPNPRVEPVDALFVTTRESEFGLQLGYRSLEVRWAVPTRGSVTVVQSRQPVPLRRGDRVDPGELERHDRLHRGTPPLSIMLLDSGLYSFVPVTEADGLGYVGRARHYAAVPEVTGLHARLLDGLVQVRWVWPSDVSEVLVTCAGRDRIDEELGPDTAASRWRVDSAAYAAAGGMFVIDPATAELAATGLVVAVYVLVERGATTYSSSGCQARPLVPVTLTYSVIRARRQPWRLEATVSLPTVLPELVVVARRDRPPRDRTDGIVLTRLPAQAVGSSRALPSVELSKVERGSYVRVFVVDDDPRLAVIHPPEG